MQDHWEHFGPPVYIAVAAYLGIVKKRKDAPKAAPASSRRVRDPETARQLMQDFMAVGGMMAPKGTMQ